MPGREVNEDIHVDFDLYRQQTGADDLGVESLDTADCVSPSRNPLERLSGANDVNQSSSPLALLTSHIRIRPAESQSPVEFESSDRTSCRPIPHTMT
jgi:hypothetical protein